jgi:hypothetical protein
MRTALLHVLLMIACAAHAHAKGCSEVSKVVGQQRCSRFGSGWDISQNPIPITIELGLVATQMPLKHLRLGGNIYDQNSQKPFLLPAGTVPDTWAAALDVRVLVFPTKRILYVGVEWEFGGMEFAAPSGPVVQALAVSTGAPTTMYPTELRTASFGSVVGVRVPLWRFDFSAEMFGGMRYSQVDVMTNAALGPCWQTQKGQACPFATVDDLYAGRAVARGAVSVRVTPWVTVGAMLGVDLANNYALAAGAYLGLHGRAYDGFFKRIKQQ